MAKLGWRTISTSAKGTKVDVQFEFGGKDIGGVQRYVVDNLLIKPTEEDIIGAADILLRLSMAGDDRAVARGKLADHEIDFAPVAKIR